MKRAIEALSSVRSSSSEGEGEAVVTNELLILSNSNAMFIELVLKHYGLFERFEGAVITNPATWDPQDPNRLILSRRVDPQATPHGCTLGCSANMCKGVCVCVFFFFFCCSSSSLLFGGLIAPSIALL